MSIKLPPITTLEEAKNVIEHLLQLIQKQEKAISLLQEEVARLKGQAKKPSFSSTTTGKKSPAFSVTGLLGEKKSWKKGSKKTHLQLTERSSYPRLPRVHVGVMNLKSCERLSESCRD